MKNTFLVFLLIFNLGIISAQKTDLLEERVIPEPILSESFISLQEFMAHVKLNHPIIKQGQLNIDAAEAELLGRRGVLDPKLKGAFENKNFGNTEYFQKFYSSFEIPTGLGLNFSASYEQNDGRYLNPENFTNNEGLYKVGIEIDVLKNLIYNERNTSIKQAKNYASLSEQEQILLINQTLEMAIMAYADWWSSYLKFEQRKRYETLAQERFISVKKLVISGQNSALDSIEARANYSQRVIHVEKAKLELIKARLYASTFLWLENQPLQIKENIIPELSTYENAKQTINVNLFSKEDWVNSHPKMLSIQLKSEIAEQQIRLKKNSLLPSLNLSYQWLSQAQNNDSFYNWSNDNYQAFASLELPIFVRKERAELKKAKIKNRDIYLDGIRESTNLIYKADGLFASEETYEKQIYLQDKITVDFQTILKGEWQKYLAGSSDFFKVQSRETKALETEIKLIELKKDWLYNRARLYNLTNF